MSMRLRIAFLVAVLAAGPAAAHAFREASAPPVGSVVCRAPAEVRLWFSERIEPRFSRARLTSDGAAIAASSAVVNGNELVPRVPRLRPRTYRVAWNWVSVDPHKTEGPVPFEVRP